MNTGSLWREDSFSNNMKFSIPLTESAFEILQQNAAPGGPASGALEASIHNVITAGVRKIFTVRCTMDVAQELQLLAVRFCPTAAFAIGGVIDARFPDSTNPERRVAAR